ncbi:MAG: prolyl oligopeptidase family serine peptidase [Planctomycetota bacterium]|nr:prolyl oligopeptidase family serine peptidase [Planctomycetota bacterium]
MSAGCVSSPGRGLPPWIDPATVRPTLEEIFLGPPIHGTPPLLDSVSADGDWCLARWSPPSEDDRKDEDDEKDEDGEAELRLFDLRDASAPPGTGTPLRLLLPGGFDEESVEKRLETAWSRHGRLLAVARENEVFVVDPARGKSGLLVAWELAEESEDEEEEEEQPAEEGEESSEPPEEKERKLGQVRRLSFAPDDGALRISDGSELFEAALPASGVPLTQATLADLRWASETLHDREREFEWSRDLAVVFGADPPPREGAQVLHRLADRAVTLEGMGAIEDLDDEALSPDGRFVFAAELDRSGDPEPTLVPDYLTERVSTREARRKLADDRPTPTKPWMWDTTSGERSAVLPRVENGDGEEGLWWWRFVGWAPQPDPDSPARFAFERRTEDFRRLELWCWSEGESRMLHAEEDPRWVGGPSRTSRWTPDGARLVFGSETTATSTTPGRAQLFVVGLAGAPARQLTAVAGEVSRYSVLDGGAVLFTYSGEDPAQRHLGLVPAATVAGESSAAPLLFATPPGTSRSARGSRAGKRPVFRHEELLRPAELWVVDESGARRLTDTVPAAFDDVDWILPERITLRSPDGVDVHAHVYLPPWVTLESPGRRRAAIVFVHGAGYLQNVTESMTSYPLNALFHSRLASMGYAVIDVDYRGSAGYGNRFRTDVQYHLGGKDLDDIHLVVDALVEGGLVDAERVGIYGGSYGGFMALMALFTAPERWSCGAALRSVTDWRTYSPGYTQPRLGRPSTHAEAYERSSPIDHAEKLEDPLLILHGMVDSNVFAQDSIRLIEELIDNKLDFDAMLYPSQGHSFRDGEHWLDEYRRIERFLLEHLGPPVIVHGRRDVYYWHEGAWVFDHDDDDGGDGGGQGFSTTVGGSNDQGSPGGGGRGRDV